MSVSKKIVGRPVLGIVVFALIAVVALFLVRDLPTDMFPDIVRPVLMINTTYRGAGPETVEKTVTQPLETQLSTISGLEKITSVSSEGMSQITLEFDVGVNLDIKQNDARDRIDMVRAQLPDDADQPRMFTFDPNALPIIRFAVRGDRDVNELQEIAQHRIQHRIEQVEGVSSTRIIGGIERQVRVEINHNRLEAYGLTITGIAQVLAAANIELGAGAIEDGTVNYSIRTTGEFATVDEIAQTVIARRGNVEIRLLDVADVFMGFPKENSAAIINGEMGVFVAVSRQSGTNSVAIADRVYVRLDEVREIMPPDVSLQIVRDSTTQIRDMINELINSALMGALLACLILFLFLRNIKSTIIIGISIPFSMLVTLLVMNAAGLTLNMFTLSGLILGIGMVVDCSVVVLDNIFKYRERGTKPNIAAALGSQEVMVPIIAGTLTTLCVFIPLMLMRSALGLIGMFLQDLIITVSISLASSLFVAIFLVPILASKYLPINTRLQKPLTFAPLRIVDNIFEGGLRAITNGYAWFLTRALRNRLITFIIVVAIFISAMLTFPTLRVVLMPPMNEDSVTLNVQLPPGTLYEDTKETMIQIEEMAKQEISGIISTVTNAGASMFGGGGGGTHTGSMTITLDIAAPGTPTSREAQNILRTIGTRFPNAIFTFSAGRMGSMTGADIDIALWINEIDQGLKTANEIKELIEENVPELMDVSLSMIEGLPQVEVVIDRNRASSLGLSISSIAREISAAMSGITATTFRHEGEEYNVVLELREEDRLKVPDLARIFVTSSTGNLIPVSNFARLETGLGPVSIQREALSRIIRVTGNLADQGRVLEVEEKIRDLLAAQYILPDGVLLTYDGQASEIRDTGSSFLAIIILALLLVFGVMAGVYESFKDPIINLFTIPLVLIGVVAIYVITGENISMFTLVGVLMLIGLAVNNGIVLVDYTNILVRRGSPVRQACIDAGKSRLRPVLMTSLTTILGLIPLAFFPGTSARFTQSIGLTVVGGLVSSTFITLFIIPILYSLLNEKIKFFDRFKKREVAA